MAEKRGLVVAVRWLLNRQRRIGSRVTQVQRPPNFDGIASGPFGLHFGAGLSLKRGRSGSNFAKRFRGKRSINTNRGMLHDIGQTNSQGAEHSGGRVNQNRRDIKLASDGAGMLRPRRAERDERVITRIVALGNRNRADGLGHVCVGDANEALGEFHRRAERVSGPVIPIARLR